MRRFALFAVASAFAAATAAHAVPPPAGTSARSVDARDRIICRRYLRTGSLVDGYRTCKTRAEWDREQENVRQLSVTDSCATRGAPEGRDFQSRPDC
jgi:hypothetical protein